MRDLTHIHLLLGITWFMAFAISLPMHINYIGWSSWSSSFEGVSTSCAPINDPASAGYSMYSAILGFILPAVIIIVLNFGIVLKMRLRSQLKISKLRKMVISCFLKNIQVVVIADKMGSRTN